MRLCRRYGAPASLAISSMLHSRNSSFVAPITGASRYTRRITSQLSRTGPTSPCRRVNSSRRVSVSPVIPKSANSLSGTSQRHAFPSGAGYSKNAHVGAAATFRARGPSRRRLLRRRARLHRLIGKGRGLEKLVHWAAISHFQTPFNPKSAIPRSRSGGTHGLHDAKKRFLAFLSAHSWVDPDYPGAAI